MTDECIHWMDPRWCGECNPPPDPEHCTACGRPLRDPISQAMGVGPVCIVQYPETRSKVIEKVRSLLQSNRGKSVRWGPLEEGNAARWQQSLDSLPGLKARYRTSDTGIYLIVRALDTPEGGGTAS